MIATPHILTSVALSRGFVNPYFLAPTAFLFHFIVDAVPHADYRIFKRDVSFKKSVFLLLSDNLIGIAAIFIIGNFLAWGATDYKLALISAFFGTLPDVFQTLAKTVFKGNKIAASYRKLHDKMHIIKIDSLRRGFLQQIAVAALAVVVIILW